MNFQQLHYSDYFVFWKLMSYYLHSQVLTKLEARYTYQHVIRELRPSIQ